MRHLIIMAISLLLALPSVSLAEVVGKLTQVEGGVELLKGGKLPAAAAKVQDEVEPGDILRTKSLSRAQITFLDNTTVTLSPESRIAIEKYLFDPSKGKRNAVLELFQGLAHLVVTQVFKVQEPDFQLKTHTGVMGVRGTEVGVRLSPNDTTFLDFHGLVQVANIFPEVGSATLDLKDMQGTVVGRDLPPTLPFTITEEDRQLFLRQLKVGPQTRTSSRDGAKQGPTADLAGVVGPTTGLSNVVGPTANLAGVSPVSTNPVNAIVNNLAVTPQVGAMASTLTLAPISFNFSGGTFNYSSLSPFTQGAFTGSFSSLSRSGYSGSYTNAAFSFTAVASPAAAVFSSTGDSGTFIVTNNIFSVSGPLGGTLTGTATMAARAVGSSNTTNVIFTGPVSITANGTMTFKPGGTFSITTASGNIINGLLTVH